MTILTYDHVVADLCAKGVPLHKAEAAARRELGMNVESFQIDHKNDVAEKQEQRECVKIFRAHGCSVYSLSQARASKQTPGLGDLFVFAPRVNAAWWFETKRASGGVQSTAQREFQELCQQCGVRYVIGDRSAAWQILRDLGVIDAHR